MCAVRQKEKSVFNLFFGICLVILWLFIIIIVTKQAELWCLLQPTFDVFASSYSISVWLNRLHELTHANSEHSLEKFIVCWPNPHTSHRKNKIYLHRNGIPQNNSERCIRIKPFVLIVCVYRLNRFIGDEMARSQANVFFEKRAISIATKENVRLFGAFIAAAVCFWS